MKVKPRLAISVLLVSAALASRANDQVFSGPQPGERISAFKVTPIGGSALQVSRDPIAENQGKPMALVFVHSVERSLVPLLRVVDEYGARRKEHLCSEIVFLSGDPIAGRERIKTVQNSLRLKSNVSLSVDGAEGPGNYGLNKECLMTVVVASGDRVITNYALVQPGISDAPRILAALAKASGDANPPSVESLLPKNQDQAAMRDRAQKSGPGGKDPLPGAVPTDEKLQGLLRRFIRPTNDDATVDSVLTEVKAHIKGNAGLKQQAVDGWTRVLHFGDHYGTAYSRKIGAEFLEGLKRELADSKPDPKP